MIMISSLVGYLYVYSLLANRIVYLNNLHGHLIEFLWTIAPALILGGIALPSFRLLYLMDEIIEPQLTVKAIGNQWYWSYEYYDLKFDSYSSTNDDPRLLNVENYLVLPIDTSIRLLVSSMDVIHSFAVPALALKIDAIPGRLNSIGFLIDRPGIYYGQCSELCGILHGFMPIALKALFL